MRWTLALLTLLMLGCIAGLTVRPASAGAGSEWWPVLEPSAVRLRGESSLIVYPSDIGLPPDATIVSIQATNHSRDRLTITPSINETTGLTVNGRQSQAAVVSLNTAFGGRLTLHGRQIDVTLVVLAYGRPRYS